MTTHRSVLAVLTGLMISLAFSSALAGERPPYIGSWSNGRGETLVVKSMTLQFADNDPAPYRDVTKVTDGSAFELMLTTNEKVNYFSKYISFNVDGKTMTMTMYRSYNDMRNGANPQGEANWEKD